MSNRNKVIGIILVTAGLVVENQSDLTLSAMDIYIDYLTFPWRSWYLGYNSLILKDKISYFISSLIIFW
jgi:hypothetical protein